MSFDYFEAVDDLTSIGSGVPGVPGDVADFISGMNGVIRKRYNSVIYPTEDGMVKDKIKHEEVQLEAPIQFDISYSTVDVSIELPDEYHESPETYDSGRYNVLQDELYNVGSRRFLDNMFDANGVKDFDDMDMFKDNPAYAISDDGFAFTDIDGLTYIVKREEHSISTQMMEFKGLSAKPMFENLPERYADKLIPEGFTVDKEAMDDNPDLNDVVEPNNQELIHFMEKLRDSHHRGEIVDEDFEFVVNTYPMRYDIKDINNPKLTRYEVPSGKEGLDRFIKDLNKITEEHYAEYKDEGNIKILNHGVVSARDVVHTSVNFIGRGIEGMRNYDLIHDVRKVEAYEMVGRQPDKSLRKTYDEVKQSDLEVDGRVVRHYGEDTHEGRNRLYMEYGLRPEMVNMHVAMSNGLSREDVSKEQPMFSEEQIAESQTLKAERESEKKKSDGHKNRESLKLLDSKFEEKESKASAVIDVPELDVVDALEL